MLELFAANNTLYYAMEYIDGLSLQTHINQHGPMSESQAISIASKVGDALSFMHQQRMLHLDLKPGNIMLRNDMTPVLIDFGLSKQYDENGAPESSTTIGAGTPGYAPIEQADYHGGRDFPVTLDIYAMGATLYKMLTGITPPVASSVMNEGLPLAPLHQRGISHHTIQVIQKAMMPMKAMRFQSVGEMKRALISTNNAIPDEHTIITDDSTLYDKSTPRPPIIPAEPATGRKTSKLLLGILIPVLLLGGLLAGYLLFSNKSHHDNSDGYSSENSIEEGYMDEDVRDAEEDMTKEIPEYTIEPIQTYYAHGVSFKMIGVQGGSFRMGSTDSDADSDERPTHMVTLNSYYIGETEVTQELWEAVMNYNPSEFQYSSQLPVEFVSWDDCRDFIRELNSITGKEFRFPSEAEWEYAARGGHQPSSTKFSGSNSIAAVGWYNSNSEETTHPVKMKKPNSLGIYDMSGNLWEWCQDWYGPYSSNNANNPSGPFSGSNKVLKGGAWNGGPKNCRLTNRDGRTTDYASNRLGLRLALSLP